MHVDTGHTTANDKNTVQSNRCFERPPPVYTGPDSMSPIVRSPPYSLMTPSERNTCTTGPSRNGSCIFQEDVVATPGSGTIDLPSSRMYYYYPSPLPGFIPPGGPFSNTTPFAPIAPLPPTMRRSYSMYSEGSVPLHPQRAPCMMYMIPVVPIQGRRASHDLVSPYPRNGLEGSFFPDAQSYPDNIIVSRCFDGGVRRTWVISND